MDMLERYLQAVRFFLPAGQEDDIVRELSENLVSQMEDRQEELGRPLTDEEQAEILRKHGHPAIVAGRYGSQQHLIGPVFFPIYLFALKTGLGVALLVTIVLAAIAAALHGDPVRHGLQAMLAFPGRALMVFAWTTLGFAGLDLTVSRVRVSQRWDPRTLPPVVRHGHRIPRLRSLCELMFSLAFVVWLLLVPRMPFLILGPAASYVDPAPVWSMAYAPILLFSLATVALYEVNFMRPHWTRARSAARIAISTGMLIVSAFLLRAGELFVARSSAGPVLPAGGQLDQVVQIINAGFQIGVVVTIVVSAIEIGREAYRLKTRRTLPPDSATARVAH